MHECQLDGETGSYQSLEAVQPLFRQEKEAWNSQDQLQPHCKQRKGKGRSAKLHAVMGVQQGRVLPPR